MQFLVTDIKFDFNTDLPDYYSVSEDDQELITRDNLGVWEAEDEDDLVEYVLDDLFNYFDKLGEHEFYEECQNYWDDSFGDVIKDIKS